MTDEQIDTMLKMHRYLIMNEINLMVLHQMNGNNRAAKLQEQKNNEEWEKFALWLRMIRDE